MPRISIQDTEDTEARNIRGGPRWTAKQFFLTYPRCSATKERLLDILKALHPIEHYVIASEEHEEEDEQGCEDLHLHAYVKFTKKLNVKDPLHFDFDDYHCHIETVKKAVACITYCKKDGDYIENKYFDDEDWTNWRQRQGDFEAWNMYKMKKSRREVEFPLHIFNYELNLGKKKRHLCLITDPDFGKSEEINRVFEGYKVFNASQGKYIMEGYEGENIILFDCVMPPWAVIESCSTVWKIPTAVPGEQRYKKYYWPMGQERVMLLLLNELPEYPPAPFEARFIIDDRRIKKKGRISKSKMGIPG